MFKSMSIFPKFFVAITWWQYVETVLTNQTILCFFLGILTSKHCISFRILFSLNNQNTIPWNIMEWFHQKIDGSGLYWKCPNHMYGRNPKMSPRNMDINHFQAKGVRARLGSSSYEGAELQNFVPYCNRRQKLNLR